MTRRTLAIVMAAACAGPTGDAMDPPTDARGPDQAPDGALVPTEIVVTLHEPHDPAFSFAAGFQDGDGAWTSIASASGVFRFTVSSPTWSFAWGCGGMFSDGVWRSSLAMIAFSAQERATFDAIASCPSEATRIDVSGTMTNAPPTTNRYAFGFGRELGYGVTQQTSSVKFIAHEYAAGTHDLYGGFATFVMGNGMSVEKVVIARGVTAPTTTAALDLGTALPTTAPQPVTISSPGATRTAASTVLADASGTRFRITDSGLGPPHTTRALDASQRQSGDLYVQSAAAFKCDDAVRCDSVEQQRWTPTPAAQTLTLAPGFGLVVTSGTGPALSATWPAVAGASGYTFLFAQGRQVYRGTIGAGFAALRGAGFTLPDLADFATILPDGLSALRGSVSAITSTLGAADLPLQDRPPTGTERTLVTSFLGRDAN